MPKLFLTTLPTLEQVSIASTAIHPDLDPLSLHTYLLLRKTSAELESNLETFFSAYGLSSGRFTLIILLKFNENGLMPSELAQQVGVTQATISGLINSLEKAGHVNRQVHEKDGRSFVIKLTEQGNKVFTEVAPVYFSRLKTFLSHFNEEEKNTLSALFNKLIANVGVISGKQT